MQAVRRAAMLGRPTEEGLVVVEGPHLLQEALDGKWTIEEIFLTSEARAHYATIMDKVDVPCTELSRRAIASIGSTETTQEVISLVRPRKWSWEDLLVRPPLILVLDGIGDPGNAGTMVRSAEAFGASGIVFLKGTVRPSNGKFTRASAGSIFRVPFLGDVEAATFIRHAHDFGVPIYALMPDSNSHLSTIRLSDGCALVVGSEGAGVSAGLLEASSPVTIPTQRVESLNAAVACSIALYAIQQQRASQ
ncbi:MAG TPA: RNA methyltransferase [Bryobacteraceae bacterium]|nr:RNA methyltransferase [Bryobacteraceae bacterium]